MALIFEKDCLGRYMVRRDDGLFIVPPTLDKTQVLPQLQAYLGSEVSQTDVAAQIAALDAAVSQPTTGLAGDQVDIQNTIIQESNPGTIEAEDTAISADDSNSNN